MGAIKLETLKTVDLPRMAYGLGWCGDGGRGRAAAPPQLSSSAKAADPVRRGFSLERGRLWDTGSLAFAGDDK
jgi:hypothetical protein